MSKLSRQQVESIANLSRLGLTEKEVEKFTTELSSILDYVEQLNELGVISAEPVAQITGLKNVASDDEIYESTYPQGELLKNAPEVQDGFIKVKPVFEERESI
jgi:aspartyl-tRNA(Asn)/glutamyl-tRNA(Gln) amidotransferase subunit C